MGPTVHTNTYTFTYFSQQHLVLDTMAPRAIRVLEIFWVYASSSSVKQLPPSVGNILPLLLEYYPYGGTPPQDISGAPLPWQAFFAGSAIQRGCIRQTSSVGVFRRPGWSGRERAGFVKTTGAAATIVFSGSRGERQAVARKEPPGAWRRERGVISSPFETDAKTETISTGARGWGRGLETREGVSPTGWITGQHGRESVRGEGVAAVPTR